MFEWNINQFQTSLDYSLEMIWTSSNIHLIVLVRLLANELMIIIRYSINEDHDWGNQIVFREIIS